MPISIEKRQQIERRIVTKAVKDLIAAGYYVAVDDGEEIHALTKNADEVLAQLFQTDEEYLYVNTSNAKPIDHHRGVQGWVHLVYGNDGWDVIADNTVNLENALMGATELADKIAEEL